jgi:hypothetical protein
MPALGESRVWQVGDLVHRAAVHNQNRILSDFVFILFNGKSGGGLQGICVCLKPAGSQGNE